MANVLVTRMGALPLFAGLDAVSEWEAEMNLFESLRDFVSTFRNVSTETDQAHAKRGGQPDSAGRLLRLLVDASDGHGRFLFRSVRFRPHCYKQGVYDERPVSL